MPRRRFSDVDGDGAGPWVSAAGHTLTITALGDQQVNNYGYSGPEPDRRSVQPEDRHPPLWLRRDAGYRIGQQSRGVNR